MSLDKSTAKLFANAVSEANKSDNPELYAYGIVKKNDDITAVILDGSDAEMPVESAMDAEDGDRVMVMVKDHKAVITGNITSPASARTASSYMKLVDDGLIVGRLKDGKPVGSYCLIGLTGEDKTKYPEGTEFYYIMNQDDSIAAKFGDDIVDLGFTDNSKINFCDGRATIEYEHNIQGQEDSEKPTDDQVSIKSNAVALVSEVNTFHPIQSTTKLANSYALAEVYQPALYDFAPFSAVAINSVLDITDDGQNLYEDTMTTLGYKKNKYISAVAITPFGINIYSDSMRINDSEVLTNSSPLFKTGTVQYKNDSEVNESGTYKTFNASVTVPSGYTLVGVTAVNNSAHVSAQRLTRFYHSGSKVYASFYFGAKCTGVTITWTWLAIRNV